MLGAYDTFGNESTEIPDPDDVLAVYQPQPVSTICQEGEVAWLWWCPGCKSCHWTRTTGRQPCWSWNGSKRKPTFSPSILVRSNTTCHVFITEGVIRFLPDCSHELAGKEVPMSTNREWLG